MKRFISICMLLGSCLTMLAQATSLVVDNQTPGWLSSKINYGDQATVRNLKVTGYINATDLKFIGTLIQNRSLDGRLDLSDANVVSETLSSKDNAIENNIFALSNASKDTLRLSCLDLPKTLTYISNFGRQSFIIDTLVYDVQIKYATASYSPSSVRHLILGANVDSIPINAFKGESNLISVVSKGKIKTIGYRAFCNCSSLNETNITLDVEYIGASAFYNHNMKNIILPDSIASIGASAFYTKKNIEEIRLPNKMKTLGNLAFNGYAPDEVHFPYGLKKACMNSFSFKEGQKYYFPETILEIDSVTCDNNQCTFYLDANEVVKIPYKRLYSSVSTVDALRKGYLLGATVYVPKGMIPVYKTSDYWYKANYQSYYGGGSTYSPPGYYVTCYWACANFQEMSYKVKYLMLDRSEVTMTKIGETVALNAIIYPDNADDKSVNWISTKPSVCMVTSDGQVVAIGDGTSTIICTSVDGGFVAICSVIVDTEITKVEEIHNEAQIIQYSQGIVLQGAQGMSVKVYDINGKNIMCKTCTNDNERINLSKGIYVIRMNNKSVKITI